MISQTTSDTGSGDFRKYIDSIKSLEEAEAKWGWLDTASDYPDGTSIHMVVAVHTYGIPSSEIPSGINEIPERDVLGRSFDARFGEYQVLAEVAYDAVVAGQPVKSALNSIAAKGATDLKRDFTRLSLAPLAASTIAGKGHSTPLIHTRHMFNQIDYGVDDG